MTRSDATSEDVTVQVNRSIIVSGAVKDVFAVAANLENLPEMTRSVESVDMPAPRAARLTLRGSSGSSGSVQPWEIDVTTWEPDQRIAWNGAVGSAKTTGQITFAELPQKQTQITVILQFSDLSEGNNEERVRSLLEDQVLDNLREFKKYAEEK